MTRNNLKNSKKEEVEDLTHITNPSLDKDKEEEERTRSLMSTPILEVTSEEEAGETIPSPDTKNRRRRRRENLQLTSVRVINLNKPESNQTQPIEPPSGNPNTSDTTPTINKNQLDRTTTTSSEGGDENKSRSPDNPFRNHPNYAPGKRFRLEGETIGWDSEEGEETVPTPKKLNRANSSPKFFKAPDLFKKSDSPRLSLSNPYPLKNTSTTPSPPPSLRSPPPRPPSRSHLPSPTPRSNPLPRPTKKLRLPWTPDELAALEEGMSHHGAKWSLILIDHGRNGRIDERLAQRTQIQLKDKARTERQARERSQRPLGVFKLACSHR